MEILFKEYFSYDPESPSFLICEKNIGWKKKGEFPSVRLHHSGYLVISVMSNKVQLHRLIWEITHGKIPDGYCVDHIDGDKTNNHIENLRLATLAKIHGTEKNRVTATLAIQREFVSIKMEIYVLIYSATVIAGKNTPMTYQS